MRRGAANILLFLAVVAGAAALFVALTGGVSLPVLTLRGARRPAIAALCLFVAWYLTAPQAERGRGLAPYVGQPGRRSARVAMAAAVCLLAFSIAHRSAAAGGSDSACYVLQAEAFAHGHATLDNPVARLLPGAANAVFAPAGFLPSATTYGAAVPICAPGLSLAMVPAFLVRPSAVFLVVPLTAALLVWLTFLYGRRLDDAMTGACAAVLVACSPIVLYQAVQPMSDVPAAAAWMAALVCPAPLLAGVYGGIAILIRPNLLLLLPLLTLTVKRGQPPFFAKKGDSRQGADTWVPALWIALGAGPMLAVLLALNHVRYGSPFASGYGDTGVLFSLAHVRANASRYAEWVFDTHTPLLLLALLAPFALRRDGARARLATTSLVAAALLLATYLAYSVFDDWWYIRFLLPAVPMVAALSVAVLRRGIAAAASTLARAAVWSPVVLAVAAGLVVARDVRVARARHVLDLAALESRFAVAGAYAARTLPTDAVIIAGQESGSLRAHGHRATIAWDAIAPDALDRTILALRHQGRPVYVVLEDAEAQPFRARFAGADAGALDWPPFALVATPVRVSFFDPGQRARYLGGDPVRTELVR